jgi:hypothetical protein
VLRKDGGRSASASNSQQDAALRQLEGSGSSRIDKTRRSWRRRDLSVVADDAGGASGAVLRGLEVTQEVVMAELSGEQEDGVEHYAEERSPISRPASHLFDDITGRQ